MKRLLFMLAVLLFSYLHADAQGYTIHGNVTDTLNQAQLEGASVTLLSAADSILVTFTRTDNNGYFTLHTNSAGRYLLMVTFPSFADYVDIVKVTNPTTDLGTVPMVSRTHLLKEFVITQQVAAIKIKGDTTEYMADSFLVKPNASVEDLLKRLPGIQVNKNGQVTAQGETVQKILVDGEEFFSDDPAVVTRNLQANVVEKVQVYDKKSNETEFSGIDDGQTTKTINLALKEDKKKGYFGKVEAGGGTNGYFQNQGMFNAFKGKQQFSLFSIISNTDKIGLGWQDKDKYGASKTSSFIDDDGQISSNSSMGEDFQNWDGKYNGEGFPKVWTGGAHYANKWDSSKQNFSGNYRYGKQAVEIEGNTITQNILPDSQYFTRQNKEQLSVSQKHSFDGYYDLQIDTSSSIRLLADAGYKHTLTSSVYNMESLDGNEQAVNNSIRKTTGDILSQSINSELLYRRKFKKKGRTFTLDIEENYTDGSNTGHLNSNNIFYGSEDTSYTIDQRKENTNQSLNLNAKATYTEPIAKHTFLLINYGYAINNSTARNFSYNRNAGTDVYNALDSNYSSNYKYNIATNSGGAVVRYVHKKVNFSLGGNASNASYRQTDLFYLDTTYRYNYFNLFPQANFAYSISRQSTLRFNYYGNTQQPTITQISPLRQNTDPLNIEIGNPSLTQEFRHNFNTNFSRYKALTSSYFYVGIGFNFVDNAISTTQNIDALGRRTYQYINVDGNHTSWGYISYSYKIKPWDIYIGSSLQANTNHIVGYINNEKNISDNNSYTLGPYFSKQKEDKYSISFNPGITYNDNKSNISTQATSYWTSENELSVWYQLPAKFEITTSLNYYWRERTTTFPQNSDVLRWDAYVGKKFTKSNQLELRASVYDILNQNKGFTRYANNNIITQNTYNTIRRYGMLTLIWNFTKTPGAQPAEK